MKLKLISFALLSGFALSSCSDGQEDLGFFRVSDGCFVTAGGCGDGGAPYYYIGANFWYGALLGSDTEYGDKQRLSAELDSLQTLSVSGTGLLPCLTTASLRLTFMT